MDLLGPGTAAILAFALAIQQMVEFLDLLVFRTEAAQLSPWRKLILRSIALALGFVAAAFCTACGMVTVAIPNEALRFVVTGFGLAGGTEGANSLLKFAKYAKENKKAEAARSQDGINGPFELHAIQRQ